GLNQNFEAKFKTKGDSASGAEAQPIKLLSINLSQMSYDFVRASKATHRISGVTTPSVSMNLHSDLLPGFEFSTSYSLFQGSTLSDSAVWKPWRESMSASLNIGQTQNPFAVLTRLFGKAVPEAQKSPAPGTTEVRPRSDDTLAARI